VSATDVAGRLLAHLRADLGQPGLEYAETPTAITGGYDTAVFSFRLRAMSPGAAAAMPLPPQWTQPLILRLLGPHHDPRRAIREQVIQDTVADMGYPAPRALVASADAGTLGGGFVIMQRLRGRPMLEEHWRGVGPTLVQMQLRLHALDAGRLVDALDRAGESGDATFDGLLQHLGDRVTSRRLDGLRQGMAWLTSNRPSSAERPVICHGDFHPQNIMISGGTVTGVLDWPNVVIADPAHDVATTLTILSLVPLSLLPMPAAVRVAVGVARRVMVARYVRGYRRHHPLDPRALAYYEAASAMRQLVRVAACRLAAAAGDGTLTPLDASDFGERLCARFARITGVTPTVPAIPAGIGRSPASGE
jgi:aminoglycoside phosphotransferase (APT) family kinase protein